jgi:hypothetical protein
MIARLGGMDGNGAVYPPYDLFRVRECYLPLTFSYLRSELVHVIRVRMLTSVLVGRDRYSIGYSLDGDARQRPAVGVERLYRLISGLLGPD